MTASKLDRDGICNAYTDMLKSDTTFLYGAGRLLQKIIYNPILYDKSKVDINNPYQLFVQCESEESEEIRANNIYENYSLSLTFNALAADPYTAYKNIDNAFEHIKILTNKQMWSFDGNAAMMLSDYYTDLTAQIYNVETVNSSLPPPIETESSILTIVVDSAILVQVNRWI